MGAGRASTEYGIIEMVKSVTGCVVVDVIEGIAHQLLFEREGDADSRLCPDFIGLGSVVVIAGRPCAGTLGASTVAQLVNGDVDSLVDGHCLGPDR